MPVSVLPPWAIQQIFDDLGALEPGAKIYTYAAGTTTNKTTYQDADRTTANANPIVANAAGRFDMWFIPGEAYKIVVKDANDVTLKTVDNIIVEDPEDVETVTADLLLSYMYISNPSIATQLLGRVDIAIAAVIPIDFAGSYGTVEDEPAASYAIDVKKNGVSVGTITVSTAGTFTFATTGSVTVSLAAGDEVALYGPAVVDASITGISCTLLADVS